MYDFVNILNNDNINEKIKFVPYTVKNDDMNLQQLNGKDLSYNNYNDIFAGLDILFSNNLSTSSPYR